MLQGITSESIYLTWFATAAGDSVARPGRPLPLCLENECDMVLQEKSWENIIGISFIISTSIRVRNCSCSYHE